MRKTQNVLSTVRAVRQRTNEGCFHVFYSYKCCVKI